MIGSVYFDLNANSVRDPDEPGLAGWTVEVLDSTDFVVSHMTTDASGGYAFITPVGCGQTFRLRQMIHGGWTQMFPPNDGVHTGVGTGCGTVLGPFDFANKGCMPPPLGITAWWPLDETSGIFAQEIVAGNDGLDINGPLHVTGIVSNALLFHSLNTYVRVNDESRLNFGTSDLSIDAWIRSSSTVTYEGIVEKRTLPPSLPFEKGYALYLRQGRLALRLGDGTAANQVEYWNPSTQDLRDGEWNHVAAVVERTGANAGTRLYVNGGLIASFPPFTSSGNLTNTTNLLIGALGPTNAPTQHFDGEIDEVELFNRAITEADIGSIISGKVFFIGKCKEYCQVPWDQTLCVNQNYVLVMVNVCNFLTIGTPQMYNLSFNGLPNGSSGAAGGCSYNGPTVFQVQVSQPITVPKGTCVQVPVKIFRPVGMPKGTVSCFEMTMTSTAPSGSRSTCRGSIYASNVVCPVSKNDTLDVASEEVAVPVQFTIRNTSGGPIVVPFSVMAMPSDMDSGEPNVMSLNGLPPGTPIESVIALNAADSADVQVSASFTERVPFRFYDVVLAIDTDGNGTPEAQSSAGIRYAEHVQPGQTGVPFDGVPQFRLFPVAPNPLQEGTLVEYELPARAHVRVELFEVGGRRVRTLVDEVREAGRSAFTLQARGLPVGVYFLRLEVAGRSVTKRIVLLR